MEEGVMMKQTPSPNFDDLRQLKLPVLSENDKWLEIMGPYMNDELRILVTRQSVLLLEKRQNANHLIQLKRQKKEVLGQLLQLTALLQRKNEEAENQADRLKAVLERINEEIDHLQFRVEIVPAETQKLNLELVEETVTVGYDQLLTDQKKITVLSRKIEALRSELLAMNEEKFALEDNASAMGQFLHSLLGKELSDALDSHYLVNDEVRVL